MTLAVDTKQRILDVAERMFADHGYAGSSLRSIIGEADVNLAAIHYHFKSKEALLEAVLVRRFEPLSEERLALLDRCEQESGRKGPVLEDVLMAFFGPPMRMILSSEEGRVFGKLVGRLHSESGPFFVGIMKKHFGPLSQRFRAALGRSLPELEPDELYWRIHFAIGVMAHTLICWDRLEVLSDGLCKATDVDAALPRLVSFVSAGFRAPAPRKGRRTRSENGS